MNLTDQGLQSIEAFAEKKRNAEVLLMCQILREIREVRELLNQREDPGNGMEEIVNELKKAILSSEN